MRASFLQKERIHRTIFRDTPLREEFMSCNKPSADFWIRQQVEFLIQLQAFGIIIRDVFNFNLYEYEERGYF